MLQKISNITATTTCDLTLVYTKQIYSSKWNYLSSLERFIGCSLCYNFVTMPAP